MWVVANTQESFLSFLKKYLFIWLCQVLLIVTAYGIYFLEQGLNLGSLHWEHGVLDIEPPGNFLESFSFFAIMVVAFYIIWIWNQSSQFNSKLIIYLLVPPFSSSVQWGNNNKLFWEQKTWFMFLCMVYLI